MMLTARLGACDWLVEAPPGASLRADQLGRWQAARLDGQLYRRLLDGRVVVYLERRGPPRDVDCPAEVHARVVALAAALAERIAGTGQVLRLAGSAEDRSVLIGALRACAEWNADRLERERVRFAEAYPEPVEILPPDRYRDVVLLPATGCPNAHCTFCAFYRGKVFRPLSMDALRRHIEAVRALFGQALGLRTGVFIGSASALSLSQRRLCQVLDLTWDLLGTRPRGAGAFWDPDHSPARSAAQWAELVERSLRAVYVGLETGLPALRQRVGKSADLDRLLEAVTRVRHAVPAERLRLGLIVMVGLGGAESVESHLRATAALIRRIPLARSDVVYLSPLVGAMPTAALTAEGERFTRALREATDARVVPYAIEQFRYFA